MSVLETMSDDEKAEVLRLLRKIQADLKVCREEQATHTRWFNRIEWTLEGIRRDREMRHRNLPAEVE